MTMECKLPASVDMRRLWVKLSSYKGITLVPTLNEYTVIYEGSRDEGFQILTLLYFVGKCRIRIKSDEEDSIAGL